MILLLFSIQNQIYSYNYDSNNKVIHHQGRDDQSLLYFMFSDKNSTAGFYELVVNVSAENINKNNISDQQQAYLAGYAEGEQTANLISMYYRNVLKDLNQSTDKNNNYTFDKFYFDYADKQLTYINDQIAKIKQIQSNGVTNSNYNITEIQWWLGVDLILNNWLKGLLDGHNAADPDFQLNLTQLYLLNSQGDMDDLEYFVDKENQHFKQSIGKFHRCTGAIRLTDDLNELFMSHNTWTSFNSGFLRIAKHYIWNIKVFSADDSLMQGTTTQEVKFSSYPGLFFSLDDFYIIRNKDKKGYQVALSILETTFHTFNESLYDEFMDRDGKAVLMWTRIQLANLMSVDAEEWNKTFQFNQSWTYNNEYLLLDYNLFQSIKQQTKNQSIDKIRSTFASSKLLSRLEVIPGYGIFELSSTQLIQDGFYVSINVPQNDFLYNISGSRKENDEDGTNYWSYNDSARLCIAKKILPTVQDESSFRNFTRYNDYKNDQCQKGDPGQGIASRYDQRAPDAPRKPSQFGCTDTKYTSVQQIFKNQFTFLVGQTYGGGSDIPKYDFSAITEIPEGFWSIFPNVWEPANLTNDEDGLAVGAVVACILVPVLLIVLGVIIWTIIFYKKGGFKRYKGKKDIFQENEELLQKDEGSQSKGGKQTESDSFISTE